MKKKLFSLQFSFVGFRISGKEIFTHPLFSGSAIMFLGSMGSNVINYVYHLVMGRILGPASYGVLASLFSVLYMISILPSSASFAVVKFIAGARNKKDAAGVYKAIKTAVFYLSVILGLIVVGLSSAIANFLHVDVGLIVIIGPILFVTLNTLVMQSTLQGLLNFWGVVGPGLVSSTAKLIFGLLFVVLGWSVFGVMFGVFLAAILANGYAYKFIKDLRKSPASTDFKLKPFIKYTGPVLVQALAFTSFFTVDLILVKHFFPPAEAGLYAALSTLGKIVYFAAQPITQVMFPVVAGRKAAGQGNRRVFVISLGVTVLVSAIVVLFYYLLPEVAIGVLYGKDYLSVQKELVWMGLFILVYTVCYLLANFLLSIGHTKVVILPLIIAFGQIAAIYVWHGSILQVVQISLASMTVLFIGFAFYLVYNQLQKKYAS